MINVYIGFDSSNYGQQLAYDVCKKSILKYNNKVNIIPLIKKDLEEKKTVINIKLSNIKIPFGLLNKSFPINLINIPFKFNTNIVFLLLQVI